MIASRRRPALAVLAAAGALSLAACGTSSSSSSASGTSSASGSSTASTSSTSSTGSAPAVTALKTASTSLGSIVVDEAGRTLYQYDDDTKGASSSVCTGACAVEWPAAHAGKGMPRLAGVTGAVGTITGVDGKEQLTLDGWPLYYFHGDAAAGDVLGQGYDGIWWVLGPDGSRITTSPSASSSSSPDDSGGGYAY